VTQYRVYFQATASLAVKVEIDDEGMNPDEAREAAIEAGYDQQPGSICAQCSGWRQPWSVDIGDYEVESGVGAVEKVD
jgi:hypothetical protein